MPVCVFNTNKIKHVTIKMQNVLPTCHTPAPNHHVHLPLVVRLSQSEMSETLEAAKTIRGDRIPEEEREKANVICRLRTAAVEYRQ